ncbi:MAG: hypothetical protein MZV65_45100 [Chromatiales bacterium]|nr:hypothetical protein [Chromatiales bacterium]
MAIPKHLSHTAIWYNRLNGFVQTKKELMRRLDTLRFEYTEITSAALQPREDELLGEELTMLENAKDLITAAKSISFIINEDETFAEITAQLTQHVKTLRGFSADLGAGAVAIEDALGAIIRRGASG